MNLSSASIMVATVPCCGRLLAPSASRAENNTTVVASIDIKICSMHQATVKTTKAKNEVSSRLSARLLVIRYGAVALQR